MKKAAKRAGNIVHDGSSSSESESDEEYGVQRVPKDNKVGTQAGLGFEEESVERSRMRAEVSVLAFIALTAQQERVSAGPNALVRAGVESQISCGHPNT